MFTGASLYHFEREEIKSKIFLIEDLEGAENVLFPDQRATDQEAYQQDDDDQRRQRQIKDGTSGGRRPGMRGGLYDE